MNLIMHPLLLNELLGEHRGEQNRNMSDNKVGMIR